MKKKLLLCKPCAVTMGACIDLVQVTREKDKKVVCEQCGRKRFGDTFYLLANRLLDLLFHF